MRYMRYLITVSDQEYQEIFFLEFSIFEYLIIPIPVCFLIL